jgi:anionic cell wall polymer biosynthesis LytR-Cps2A-Psr (LCP) family protein
MIDKTTARLFAISFSLSLFVISLLYMFLTVTISPRTPPSLMADAVEEAYIPDKQDALTVLFFGEEAPGSVAGTYILLQFNPMAGKVYVAPLPPQTKLIHGGKKETIAEAYRFGGARYTRDALEEHLNIPINRHLRASANAFILAANNIGTIEFDIKEETTIADGDSYATLSPGLHLLDGRRMIGIVRESQNSPEQRAALAGELAGAAINQRIDIAASTLSDRIFESIINLIDTDISYADYEQRKLPARHMAEKENIAEIIPMRGWWQDGVFTIYDTDIARLGSLFL